MPSEATDTQPYGGVANALRVSVNAVVFNPLGQVLLQQRADNGHWNLPGGHLELGERLDLAVVRETLEETGLLVEVIRLVGVYSDPSHTTMQQRGGQRVQFVVAVFECRPLADPLLPQPLAGDQESLALGWFDPDHLPSPFAPNHRPRLRDALARQTAAFFR
jgi:8-oxo-dGTP pyrophosphatase MutT (NUDIX family)